MEHGFIDPHVHFRDFNQKHKETIAHGLEVARDSGLIAVLDMPNTDPPIMSKELVKERLNLAKDANIPEVYYSLYMGLTSDMDQVKSAVDIYSEFDQVIGMKLYAGHSVGDLGIIKISDQHNIYSTLAEEGYKGVLVVHAEKECEMDSSIFDHTNPITHCFARPEKAEIESVKDQIKLAKSAGFEGKLHIAHISSPVAVELVNDSKEYLDISCGICPHHFIFDWGQMYTEQGILYKMNPPLRSQESRKEIMEMLRNGKIDWIETDHAPHSLTEKTENPFMSGLPGISWWPVFREYLIKEDFSEKQIRELTFQNALNRFGLDLTYQKRKFKDRTSEKDYAFNPYIDLERNLGINKNP